MAGGLIGLVAYGAHDVFLTGDPQITYFKSSYRRYTHFQMEAIEQDFTGNANFGRKVTATVSRNADLIGRAYLQITLPAVTSAGSGSGFSWVRNIGHHIVKSVRVDVGGQELDKHYGDWLDVWASLTLPTGQQTGYDNMVGNISTLTGTFPGFAASSGASTPETELMVPLQFWWNRRSSLYIPLIALQFHDVKIEVEFRPLVECYRGVYAGSAPVLGSTSLWIDYVYLDTDERKKFAKFPHEYLIEQVQFQGEESMSGSTAAVKLTFNHTVKEIVFFIRRDDNTDSSNNEYLDYSNYTDKHVDNDGGNPVATALLRLNGQDRFRERNGRYFHYVQPYQHHTNTPAEGINVYSFALRPEDHQPSGTVNMSRIDNAELKLTAVSGLSSVSKKVSVYATNYNIFRIGSGLGGLAFAS